MKLQTSNSNEWLLWQLADSAFPAGGFAHSGGLEAAWQNGEVGSVDALLEFVQASLNQLGHSAVPLLVEAHVHPERLLELDAVNDAFLSNHVANRASRLQGRAFLAAAERSFGPGAISKLREVPEGTVPPVHLAPIFGAVLRVLEVDLASCIRLFVFVAMRGVVASAIRLGIIGPLQAQSVQFKLAPAAEEVCRRSAELSLDDLTQTAPLLDIWQGSHDRLYSRLFQT